MKIIIIDTYGNRRLVKRIFEQPGNKQDATDYCVEYLINKDLDRWGIEYFNKSRRLVERRFRNI